MPADPTTGTGRTAGTRPQSTLGSWNRFTYSLASWLPARMQAARVIRQRARRRLS
jgi:hypothetical protein